MLRLHFTPADLTRVRIADRPYAQFEVVGAAMSRGVVGFTARLLTVQLRDVHRWTRIVADC